MLALAMLFLSSGHGGGGPRGESNGIVSQPLLVSCLAYPLERLFESRRGGTRLVTTTFGRAAGWHVTTSQPSVVVELAAGASSSSSSPDDPDASMDPPPEEKNSKNISSQSNNRTRTATDVSSMAKLDRRLAKIEAMCTTRISRLEELVSRQEVELHRLRKTCADLSEVSEAFARLLQLLQESELGDGADAEDIESSSGSSGSISTLLSSSGDETRRRSSDSSGNDNQAQKSASLSSSSSKVVESFDDAMIFGQAPSSVIDAADAAGGAILAGMLGGKQRMLVDVRDAELSTDPETLVQFIELAILPVAAGLEGLKSTRNRVKIVFPKVSQLLEYRRSTF